MHSWQISFNILFFKATIKKNNLGKQDIFTTITFLERQSEKETNAVKIFFEKVGSGSINKTNKFSRESRVLSFIFLKKS